MKQSLLRDSLYHPNPRSRNSLGLGDRPTTSMGVRRCIVPVGRRSAMLSVSHFGASRTGNEFDHSYSSIVTVGGSQDLGLLTRRTRHDGGTATKPPEPHASTLSSQPTLRRTSSPSGRLNQMCMPPLGVCDLAVSRFSNSSPNRSAS